MDGGDTTDGHDGAGGLMPRKRLLAPEFFTHDELYAAEQECGLPLRLAFAGLWTQADRRGVFSWKPLRLKLAILPFDPCDFSVVLQALERNGFVAQYACGGKTYGFIPSFSRWQTFHFNEKPSNDPPPPIDFVADETPMEPAGLGSRRGPNPRRANDVVFQHRAGTSKPGAEPSKLGAEPSNGRLGTEFGGVSTTVTVTGTGTGTVTSTVTGTGTTTATATAVREAETSPIDQRHISDVSPTNPGTVTEPSQNDQRHISDVSAPRPTTYDLRPTSSSLAVASRTTPGATAAAAAATAGREAEALTGAVRSLPVGGGKASVPVLEPHDRVHADRRHDDDHTKTIRLLTAAGNKGISERYGEQPVPIHASSAGSYRCAELLTAADVPLDFAANAIFECARTLTLERPPRSLGYFVQHVIDRWCAEGARRDAAAFTPSATATAAKPAEGDQLRYAAMRYAQEGSAEWQAYCDERQIVWQVKTA